MICAAVLLCLLCVLATGCVAVWCAIGTIESAACPAGLWIPATPDSAGQTLPPYPALRALRA
jgi:hypothetical protein